MDLCSGDQCECAGAFCGCPYFIGFGQPSLNSDPDRYSFLYSEEHTRDPETKNPDVLQKPSFSQALFMAELKTKEPVPLTQDELALAPPPPMVRQKNSNGQRENDN